MFLAKRANPLPLPPKPYVLSPSGSFDGNDGQWSTFFINLGDDGKGHGQNFKVLISTSSPITLLPEQTEWCNASCAKSRGVVDSNGKQPLGLEKSNFWKDAGIYSIPLPYWWTKDLTIDSTEVPTGTWGSESLGLGESSNLSPILLEQYVVKHNLKDFFLGTLGLAVGEVGPPGGTKPNFLDNFYKSANQISSASFGYTAGASYRNNGKGVLGNLVLGGYDKSLFTSQGTSISMPSTKNNTLLVGVLSILYEPDPDVEANRFSFTQEGFSAVIDSTIPYLILPDNICDQFQQRFRLTLDEGRNLYTINASAHDWNTNQNATVSFKIGDDPRDSDKFTSIVLSYAAFEKYISFPITNQSVRYFPIKKSRNGIYVLGRTFLQESYIVVDYERSNFTVAPAYFSEPMPDQSLVTIFNKTSNGFDRIETTKSGLPAGAIAGIVVGIVLAFVLAGVFAFFWWKKRRNSKKKALLQYEKPSEIDTVAAGNEVKYRRVSELTGSETLYSPKTPTAGYYTNDHKSIPPISEMSPESPPVELYSPPPESANERDSYDYFGASKPRRRGATRDRDSSGQNTPGTPIAELAGDDGKYQVSGQHFDVVSPLQSPMHSRGPSDTSLSTNIDEVLAGNEEAVRSVSAEELPPPNHSRESANADGLTKVEAAPMHEDAEADNHPTQERRPSHARGLSDTTIQSDSTAVSQPTPEELEIWARSADDEPRRPLSH